MRQRREILTDLKHVEQYLLKLREESHHCGQRAKIVWINFGVYATQKSSMYSNFYMNNLGERYFEKQHVVMGTLSRTRDELHRAKYRMDNWKWYMFTGRSELTKKIETLEEDVRLLSCLVRTHDESKDELSVIAGERQVVKDRLRSMHECARRIQTELHEHDLRKLFNDCDTMCPGIANGDEQ